MCSFLQCMMGGAWFESLFGNKQECKPETLAELAQDTIRDHLGIDQKPFRVITNIQKVGLISGKPRSFVNKIFPYMIAAAMAAADIMTR